MAIRRNMGFPLAESKFDGDPPSTKPQPSDTIRVSSTDRALAKKKLQKKFGGIIPRNAKLTLKDGKYTYTVITKK